MTLKIQVVFKDALIKELMEECRLDSVEQLKGFVKGLYMQNEILTERIDEGTAEVIVEVNE